ncbi:hypothetical protein BJX63DRAFT_3640 [Aspergillus granulosus]|uniref:Uncharacterized protein n=1 Tax=Aspergillus granulosus TaxID=176169 RepID=A0ABR4I5I4_9EURO
MVQLNMRWVKHYLHYLVFLKAGVIRFLTIPERNPISWPRYNNTLLPQDSRLQRDIQINTYPITRQEPIRNRTIFSRLQIQLDQPADARLVLLLKRSNNNSIQSCPSRCKMGINMLPSPDFFLPSYFIPTSAGRVGSRRAVKAS